MLTGEGETMASALSREETKSTKAAPVTPPRRCIICCDDEVPGSDLLKPCRACNSDYCRHCLLDMFYAAIEDHRRMPPKCCTLIQIHMVLRDLGDQDASDYRAKFEEWLTPNKTYCPAPKCSAFISERLLPPTPPSPQSPASPASPLSSGSPKSSLRPVILEVLDRVSASHNARFFRGELPITELPGFTKVIQQHMDLGIIRDNIDNYRSMSDVTADINLIVSNAIEYNGRQHPVTEAAHQLNYLYHHELADAMDRIIKSPREKSPSSPPFFPCPKCHIAICTRCRQIEHGNAPCDYSASDRETAMLQTYGYKRCPRCHAGVKKMYGCSHIQCHCGAHWCYYCQRSTGECMGECDDQVDDDDDDDDDLDDLDDELDYDSEISEMDGVGNEDLVATFEGVKNENPSTAAPLPAGRPSNATLTVATAHTIAPAASGPVPAQNNHKVVNLDAGGGRRWAESDYDFGEEPDEESVAEIWCCMHRFEPFVAPPNDRLNRGDLDRMECNRCFDKVVGKPAPPPLIVQPLVAKNAVPKKLRQKWGGAPKSSDVLMKDAPPSKKPQAATQQKEAIECVRCHVLVCPPCRDHYMAHPRKGLDKEQTQTV